MTSRSSHYEFSPFIRSTCLVASSVCNERRILAMVHAGSRRNGKKKKKKKKKKERKYQEETKKKKMAGSVNKKL